MSNARENVRAGSICPGENEVHIAEQESCGTYTMNLTYIPRRTASTADQLDAFERQTLVIKQPKPFHRLHTQRPRKNSTTRLADLSVCFRSHYHKIHI
jgi:hypothetical protein